MVHGCGKSTLATNLETFNPNKYYRVIETTTRAKRDDEIKDISYHFVSKETFEENKHKMFEKVEMQFSPDKYGALKEDLHPEKWNLVVASIEGFFSGALNFSKENNNQILVNILVDSEIDIERVGRNHELEERMNKAALCPFYFSGTTDFSEGLYISNAFVQYYELHLSDLKKNNNRNNPEWLLKIFDEYTAKAKIPVRR